jgi:hypothetical protein
MIDVRRWFLRGLAAVYFVAFLSLGVQIQGLIGSKGILPAAELLADVRAEAPGLERFQLLPTLAWVSDSDGFLSFLCWGGAGLAVVLAMDVAPALVLGLLWVFYLSLVQVGQVFLGYQWDALLLEAGLLAVFVAPLRLRPRLAATDCPTSPLAVFMLRFLLFRLMWSSGAVKLLSGDETWRSLRALTVHYETQPLPAPTSWFVHQLPAGFHELSCAVLLGIELLVPLLVFGPRRARLVAFWPLVVLQALIALTGNYAFFNLLTVVLCLMLLDDRALPARLRGPAADSAAAEAPPSRPWPRVILWPVAAVLLSAAAAHQLWTVGLRPPAPLLVPARLVAPFAAVNGYGLFAIMTTSRPEIVVEGSDDGLEWKAYAFRSKPGDPARIPGFVAPHQPRLDWQMWFAALGTCEHNPWFTRFLLRLSEASPPVLALLAHDPFAGRPPRFLRAVVYDYRFTDVAARRRTGDWWSRTQTGLYCPALGEPPEAETP